MGIQETWNVTHARPHEAEAAENAARRLSTFAQSFERYLSTLAPGPDAVAARAAWTPWLTAILALDVAEADIRKDGNLSEIGRQSALAKLHEKRATVGLELQAMVDATRKIVTSISDLEERALNIATGGLVWHEQHQGYTRTKPADLTPEQIALEREFRDVVRARYFGATPKPTDWRMEYRRLVVDRDERALIAERDPVGELVSQDDAAWARKWRIENSDYAPKIADLRAKFRTYGLLLGAAERALGVRETQW